LARDADRSFGVAKAQSSERLQVGWGATSRRLYSLQGSA